MTDGRGSSGSTVATGAVASYPPSTVMTTSGLYAHQQEAVDFAEGHPRCGLMLDTGTGKTRVGLEILRRHRGPSVVLCPLSIVWQAWGRDREKFAPDLDLRPILERTPIKRKKATAEILDRGGVAVLGYEAAKTVRDVLDRDIELLVIDESSRLKALTQQTRLVLKLAARAKRIVLFSGCPAPNTPLEYYWQGRALDGAIFGPTFYGFRATYGRPVRQVAPGIFKWVVPQENEKKILAKLSPVVIWRKKEDCIDLPPIVEQTYEAAMNPKQATAYREMLAEAVAELDRTQVAAVNVLAKTMKLREITGGFVYDNAGIAHKLGDGKVKVALEILETLGGRPALLWIQFRPEAAALKAALGDLAGELHGAVGPAEREASISAFREGKLRYLICHPRSVGHGLTLVEASDAIYLSHSHSWEEFMQSRDRIHRIGQGRKVTVHHIIVPDTIDEAILAAVRAKGNFQDRAADWLRASGPGRPRSVAAASAGVVQ